MHEYKDSAFHEAQRRGLLFELARQIPVAGKRLLLAIDADEFLTANLFDSAEWERILAAPIGATVHIERLESIAGHGAVLA